MEERMTSRNGSEDLASDPAGHAGVSEQALLNEILGTPIEYVDSEEFRRAGAERRIFDEAPTVRRADVAWYRPLMDPIGTTSRQPKRRDSIVLTAAEERVIFLQYNYARFRVRRVQDRVKSRRPGPRQRETLLLWYRIAQHLRHRIAEANLALVLAMSKRIRLGDMEFSDLISEGNMALMRSIDKFDVGRGFKFSTYACRAILKGFSRHGSKHLRYRQRFGATYDPEFERSNYPEERRREELLDSADEVKQFVLQNQADLTEVEREVIHHRFRIGPGEAAGLRHERPRTLAQVGKMIGLTKERVRQIQNKALGKLRLAVEESSLPSAERPAFRKGWRKSVG
ncbi:MAG: sigma-70 family RNA polymerase sigma factor [Phycisphaerales bacterium]|jgi:RNA polymerase sigma factor (sigma-70 family)|nr:sigma-70 family RNA polymerase sigma factor [Phycisphaerales bacterium]